MSISLTQVLDGLLRLAQDPGTAPPAFRLGDAAPDPAAPAGSDPAAAGPLVASSPNPAAGSKEPAKARSAEELAGAGIMADVNKDGRITSDDLFKVTDANGDGKVDHYDAQEITQKGQSILTEPYQKADPSKAGEIIAESAGRITLFGEFHVAPPSKLVDSTVAAMVKDGKDVLFAYEFSDVPPHDFKREGSDKPLREENPDLYYNVQNTLKAFNEGKIPAEDLETRLMAAMQENPGYSTRYSKSNLAAVADAIGNAAVQGARQVHMVDQDRNGPDGDKINRDEMMAKRIADIAEANPNSSVVGLIGSWHIPEVAYGEPGDSVAGHPNNFIDPINPAGRRLSEKFGEDEVTTVLTQGILSEYGVQPPEKNEELLYTWLKGYIDGNADGRRYDFIVP